MSSAEVASRSYKGFMLTEEERNPRDIEVPLQTITVQLPEEPLLVNGSSYGFEVEGERLCQAINTVRQTFRRPGKFEPTSLSVTLGDSLPPKIADADEAKQPKLFDIDTAALRIELPGEVIKSNMPARLLASQIEDVLNQDLAAGIEQVRQRKNFYGHRLSLFGGSLAIGALLGEGTGIEAGSSSLQGILERGTAGAVGAAILVTGVGIAKIYYTDWRLKRKTGLSGDEYKVQRRVEENGIGKDLETLFEEPIIKLVPSQATSETT